MSAAAQQSMVARPDVQPQAQARWGIEVETCCSCVRAAESCICVRCYVYVGCHQQLPDTPAALAAAWLLLLSW